MNAQMPYSLATTSEEEGLDFACNLAVRGLIGIAQLSPEKAPETLIHFAQYVQFRYAGELELALEYLSDIGHMLPQEQFRSEQFWAQMYWVAQRMGLDPTQMEELKISPPMSPSANT
jgi:hypothetical protein